jgi:hypothetical protein
MQAARVNCDRQVARPTEIKVDSTMPYRFGDVIRSRSSFKLRALASDTVFTP